MGQGDEVVPVEVVEFLLVDYPSEGLYVSTFPLVRTGGVFKVLDDW